MSKGEHDAILFLLGKKRKKCLRVGWGVVIATWVASGAMCNVKTSSSSPSSFYTSHDLISCGRGKVYKKPPTMDQQSTVVIWLPMEQHHPTFELSQSPSKVSYLFNCLLLLLLFDLFDFGLGIFLHFFFF